MDRFWRGALAVALFTAFCGVVLIGGHGGGFVWMALVDGLHSMWVLPVFLGWAGAALLVPAAASRRMRMAMGLNAALCLAVAMAIFVTMSEAWQLTLITAIPFLVLLVFWVLAVLRRKPKPVVESVAG